jgi:hypothetical protein
MQAGFMGTLTWLRYITWVKLAPAFHKKGNGPVVPPPFENREGRGSLKEKGGPPKARKYLP